MNDSRFWSSRFHVLISAVAFVSLAVVLWWFLTERATWSRAEAFGVALGSLIKKTNTDESLVAQAIFNNYIETRIIAARWRAVYWGFTFDGFVNQCTKINVNHDFSFFWSASHLTEGDNSTESILPFQ